MSNIELYKRLIKQAEESGDDFAKSAIPDLKLQLANEINYVQNKEIKNEPQFKYQWQFDKYQREQTSKRNKKDYEKNKVKEVPKKWYNHSQSYINIEDITEELEDREEVWTNNYVDHLSDLK
tara:strand:+ start:2179 stop:2544 length:366 start_codon:yes stop_codon:yes gene_type:complete